MESRRTPIASEGRILQISTSARPTKLGKDVEALLMTCFPRVDESFLRKMLNNTRTNAILLVSDQPVHVSGMFDIHYGRAHGQAQDTLFGLTQEDEIGEPHNEETDDSEDDSDSDSDGTSSDDDSSNDENGADGSDEDDPLSKDTSAREANDAKPSSGADPEGVHLLGCLLYTWETQAWNDPASLYTSITDPSLTPTLQETVAQVSLVAVRHRYRRRGVGSRLVRELQRCAQAKEAKAVIVYADPSGAEFFRRLGYSSEPVANLKYRSFPDFLSRSTLLSRQLGPRIAFPGHPRDRVPYAGASDITQRIEAWKAARSAAFSIELGMMETMNTHIKELRTRLLQRESQLDTALRSSAALELENRRLKEQVENLRELLRGPKPAQPSPEAPLSVHVNAVKSLLQSFGRFVEPTSTEFAAIQKEVVSSIHPSHGVSSIHVHAVVALDHEANNTAIAQRFAALEKERVEAMDSDRDGSSNASGGLRPMDILSVRLFFGDDAHRIHAFATNGFPVSASAEAKEGEEESKGPDAETSAGPAIQSNTNDVLAEFGKGFYFTRCVHQFSPCFHTALVFMSYPPWRGLP